MKTMHLNTILVGAGIAIAVGGWIVYLRVNQPTLPIHSDQSSQATVTIPPQKVGEIDPSPVAPPRTDDERHLLAIQQYTMASHPTPEGKVAALAGVTYFTSHPNPAALTTLIQHINLRNHPWDKEPNQLHVGGLSSDPPIEQIYPVVAALEAYGSVGTDAIIDALLAKNQLNLHDEPYNLMVETLFHTLDRDQLRLRVEQHLKPDKNTPEIQLQCKALLKQLFG